MTREEQNKFVIELSQSARNKLLDIIQDGDIPADWTGIELRQLFADVSRAQTLTGGMSRKRVMEYRNLILTRNLV